MGSIRLTVSPASRTPAFGIFDRTELLIGVLLIATGFLLGIYAVVLVRRVLEGYASTRLRRAVRLSDVFTPGNDRTSWDPSGISAEPATSEVASPEEVVLRLLIRNGGRIRQRDLIRETGWSEAKVSRLLQRMEDRGDISRVHIGRNNLVVLGDFESAEQSKP